jgi:hypothetical protein
LALLEGINVIQLVPPFQTSEPLFLLGGLNIIDCERPISAGRPTVVSNREKLSRAIFHFHYGLNLDLAHHRVLIKRRAASGLNFCVPIIHKWVAMDAVPESD